MLYVAPPTIWLSAAITLGYLGIVAMIMLYLERAHLVLELTMAVGPEVYPQGTINGRGENSKAGRYVSVRVLEPDGAVLVTQTY